MLKWLIDFFLKDLRNETLLNRSVESFTSGVLSTSLCF